MKALIRRPSPRLAEGLVTHIERVSVDVDLAVKQHDEYAAALRAHGWETVDVPPAPDCPDSVFIEDTVVVRGDLAIVTRPGAATRRPETEDVPAVVRELGLTVARIEAPGTLDGGDVLQVDDTVYVGQSERTNASGIRQLRALLGANVIPVPLSGTLHLKSAVTALPDKTFLIFSGVPVELFPRVRKVDEEAGAHVVHLGGDRVLMSASAPRTVGMLEDLGFEPVVVDIGEFEKLEGCVTCLSVLV